MTGFDKTFETWLLDNGLFVPTGIEEELLDQNRDTMSEVTTSDGNLFSLSEPYPAAEIQGIDTWINSDGETLADLKGRVVLIDFWTYSCINCIRTVPFVNSWYEKYQDDGLGGDRLTCARICL